MADKQPGSIARLARSYRRLFYPNFALVRAALRDIRKSIPIDRVSTILDVGAGACPYRELIARVWNIDRYLAVDLDPTDTTEVVADARRLPVASNSVDMVVSFDVIQHIPFADVAVSEMYRILKPGGILIISFPFMYSECDFRDFYRWTIDGMTLELERRNFSVLWSRRRGGTMYMLGSMLLWGAQHLLPGARDGWRTRPGIRAYARAALSYLFALPVIPIAWIGLLIDRAFPSRDVYMGAVMAAQKIEV